MKSNINYKILFVAIGKLNNWFSLVDGPVFRSYNFPWIRDIELSYRIIKDEYKNISHRNIPPVNNISSKMVSFSDDKWKSFMLCAYGIKNERNCSLCPETMKVLEKIPGLQTAMFSVLEPDGLIDYHAGPYNGEIRCLFGIDVISAESFISVGDNGSYTTRYHKNGRAIFFDDTYPHTAANCSKENRVLLLLGFERPVKWPFNLINRYALKLLGKTNYVQEGVNRLMEYNRLHD